MLLHHLNYIYRSYARGYGFRYFVGRRQPFMIAKRQSLTEYEVNPPLEDKNSSLINMMLNFKCHFKLSRCRFIELEIRRFEYSSAPLVCLYARGTSFRTQGTDSLLLIQAK